MSSAARWGWIALAGLMLSGCEVIDYKSSADGDGDTETAAAAEAAPAAAPAAEEDPVTTTAIVEADPGLPGAGESRQISNRDGGGGFVSNPANSRGVLKIIWPSRYTGHITGVVAVQSGFSDRLTRSLPNEDGDRERYYGSHAPSAYPANLTVTASLDTGGSIYVVLPDPAQRYD